MNPRQLRGWLLQQPRPALLRITTGDDEPRELRPGRSFAKTAETIVALNPELVEALDGAGKLLRACNLRDDEQGPSPDVEAPEVLKTDPQAAMLMLFGRLLARAYEHSQEIAFNKLVELTDKMGDRADSIERRLERSEANARRDWRERVEAEHELDLAEMAAEAEKAKAEEDNFGSQLMQSFMGGKHQRASSPPNGKGGSS